jgi:hypothetical protein
VIKNERIPGVSFTSRIGLRRALLSVLTAAALALLCGILASTSASAATAPITQGGSPAGAGPRISHDRTTIQPDSHLAGGFSRYRIINYATGRCLDSDGQGDVYTLPCNGGNYQNWDGLWNSQWAHGGGYALEDDQTTLCTYIDTRLPYTEPCAEIFNPIFHITWDANTPAMQIRPDSLVGAAPGGGDYCLDSNDAGQVYTNPCQDGNGYQNWWVG